MKLQAMSAYGYEIVQTLIVDIEPDVHVKRAMNEINAGEKSTFVYTNFFVIISQFFLTQLNSGSCKAEGSR